MIKESLKNLHRMFIKTILQNINLIKYKSYE